MLGLKECPLLGEAIDELLVGCRDVYSLKKWTKEFRFDPECI